MCLRKHYNYGLLMGICRSVPIHIGTRTWTVLCRIEGHFRCIHHGRSNSNARHALHSEEKQRDLLRRNRRLQIGVMQ